MPSDVSASSVGVVQSVAALMCEWCDHGVDSTEMNVGVDGHVFPFAYHFNGARALFELRVGTRVDLQYAYAARLRFTRLWEPRCQPNDQIHVISITSAGRMCAVGRRMMDTLSQALGTPKSVLQQLMSKTVASHMGTV